MCFVGLLFGLAISCDGPRGTANEVRKAIPEAEVLNQPPSVVQDRLRSLILPNGERLSVGKFDPNRRIIWTQVRDQHMRARDNWNVIVIVHVDTVPRAVRIEAYQSAVNPL
jgi:hypothetical protein